MPAHAAHARLSASQPLAGTTTPGKPSQPVQRQGDVDNGSHGGGREADLADDV